MKKDKRVSSQLNKENFIALIHAIIAGITVIGLVVTLVILTCLRTVPKFNDRKLELGKPVPSHVYNYVTGLSYFHDGIDVDYSQVDNMTVGDYQVKISGKIDYVSTIHVVDTTAPEIKVLGPVSEGKSLANEYSGVYYSEADGCIVLELGESYDVFDIVENLGDTSERFKVDLSIDGVSIAKYSSYPERASEMFSMSEIGDYIIDMDATDAEGNVSSAVIATKVVDTKGPDIKVPAHLPYYATNSEYETMDFATEITDASGVAEYYLAVNGIRTDSIMYSELGSYDIEIVAVDNNGNESSVEFSADFDTVPVFVGVRDEIDIRVGQEFDYHQYFRAFDNTDGDISDRIEFICEAEDFSFVGLYDYECRVTDSHELTTIYQGKIFVGDISNTNYVLTSEEIDTLNLYDYYSYDVLENDDYDMMLETVRPTLVNLLKRNAGGGYSFGSGFIYKVDSDFVYIGTVDHVISEMITTIELMFCDDEDTILNVSVTGCERVDSSSETAMFKIPVSEIPASVLLDVKQVYVDENIYDEIEIGQEIVAYSGHWSNTTPTIRDLYVKRMDEQFLEDSVHCIVTTHNTKGGMSGCPIFDLRGKLVAICEGYWGRYNYDTYSYEYEGYQQRIEGINELYYRVKDLDYYDAG